MVILDFRKVVAVFTTFLFIATSINFNSELYAQPVAASLPALDIHKITVNGSAASLEERFQGHEGPNSRTVIAVQDAHGIFDAQENIRVVIQELQDQYGFELVGLEGGVGKSDHTFLRTFPDKEINAEQARKYMKRAELSGGEAAAILNPKPGIFYGIENRDLYFQNRNSFIKALEHKDTNLHALNLAEKNLDKTRSKIFPEKLLAFHKSVQNFRRGRMSLLDFAIVLQSESAAAAIPMNAYPNVLRLFEAIAKARKAGNKEAVNKEVEEATSKIEGRVLFEEIDVLTQEVILSFRRRPESRKIEELLTQYNELQIIRNLVSLQLTRKEYLEFLKLSAEGRIRRGGDSDNYKSLHLTPAETFYRDAVKRDHALYDNFIAAMNREKKDRAIIVTGGFHEEGLRDRLRKENISYVFYAPRIQTITPQDDYYRVMEGKVSYNNKNGRTSSIQAILATMGLDPKLEKEFNQAYAVGGLRALAKEVGSAGSLQPYAKIWQDAIIKTVKERGETLRDPSDLIALVKNAVQLASGQEDVGVMLDHLKQSFSETLSGESRDRVNRFIDDLKQNDFNVEKALAVEGRSLGADPQIESLMREVAADPDNASFRRALVLALLRAKRLDESINALRRGGFGIVDVSPNVRNQIENILNQMAGSIREMPRGTEEDRLAVERVLRNYLLLIRDIQQWPPESRARINGIRAELLAEPGVSSIVAGYRERMRVLARPIFVNKGLNPDAEFDFDEAYYNPQFYTDPNWFAVDPDTLNVSINLSGHRVIQEDFLILSQIPTLVSLDLTAARYNTGELYNFLAAHSNRESLEVNTFTGMPITAASLGVDPELAGRQRLAAVDLLNDQIQTRVYWEELRAGRYQDAFSRIRRFQQMAGSLEDRNLLKTRVYQTAQSLSESVRRGALDIESMFRLLEILGAFDWNESEMEVIRPLRADILAREGMPERIDRYSANTRRAVYALFDSNYSVISEQYLNQRLSINRETLGVNLDVSNSGLEDVEALSQIPNLEELNLGSNPLKNIRSVGRLTRLRLLYLNWNPLSDIDSLVNLYRLTRLDLNSTGVGDASVSEFFRAPENPRETRLQKILRNLRSFWYRRELTPIRNSEWINLTVISRSGRQIRWQGTPESGSPEVIPELPIEEIMEAQGASLGRADMLGNFLEFPADVWIGPSLMGEFRKRNGGKDVQVVKISGDPDEIKSQLADQLEGIPDAEYVFTILDIEKPGTKALDHVVVLDTAEKIRKESARLTSLSGIALNMFQYVLVLNVRFAGDEAPPLLSLDAISVAPELQGQKLMAETFLRIVGALENKFSGLPIAALATSRITAKWFNEYFGAKIMWADDLRDYYKYISMNLDASTLAKMRQRIAEKFPEPIRSQETPPDLNWAIENMDVWPHVRLWGTVGLRKPAPALVTAASLGRQEKFQSDELQLLASELGFGVFDGDSRAVAASLNLKINADSTDALGEALYQHILAGLPKLFDNQQNAVRLLLQSKRVLNEADARKIAEDLLNQDAFRNLAGKPEVREKLAKVFTGIVRGAGLEVIDAKRKEEALVRDEALAMFNKNFAASESQADIESALFAELAENQERLWIPAFAGMTKQTREKYQIVPHIGSLAQDREGVKLFISNAFAAVPEGSSVQIDVIYPRGSKERVSGLESYLEEVRKSLPEFASRIRMRELDQRDLVSKLSSYEKRAERDPNQYLIMVMPDAEIAAQVRGASVMIVNDSEIPDELEFVKGYVSKAAVGLAKALKLPKDDPRRTKYLGLLAEAGLTATEDAASGQIIISLNLRQFVQHLVDLQRARAAIAKAA